MMARCIGWSHGLKEPSIGYSCPLKELPAFFTTLGHKKLTAWIAKIKEKKQEMITLKLNRELIR